MASDSQGRTTVYHLTDDPRFKLDKTFEPQDNSLSINPRDGRKGLYVGEPERWAGPPYGYKRPYVVELSLPSGMKETGRWGGENFIPAESFDDVKVERVMPYDHYVRRKYGVPGDTEDYLQKTYDTDEPLERTPGRGMARYPETIDTKKEIDTRYPQQWSDEDHKKYLKNRRDFLHDSYGWGWNEFDDEGGWRTPEDDEYDGNGELIRRDREGNRMTVDKTGAVHPIKPWVPWADLMGLSPEQSAFQRTHPDVRQQALTDMLQNGHLGRYNHLINVHRAQSMVDRVRAKQGRPSPYSHPSEPQPWHGGSWVQHPQGTTMMMNRVQAAVQEGDTSHGLGSGHVAPGEGNPTFDDPTDYLPNVYEHPEYYITPRGADTDHYRAGVESFLALKAARGNPDADVKIYRAVPHGVSSIEGNTNPAGASWVSASPTYAAKHAWAESCPSCGGDMQVISGTAKAHQLHNEGYINEWGYSGDPIHDPSALTECPEGAYEARKAAEAEFNQRHAAANPEDGLKAAGIAVIAMDTGRVLMLQRALNPLHCPCGQGVTWDEMNGYQHDDGSVSHDDSDLSVSEMLDQGHDGDGLTAEAAIERDDHEGEWEFPGGCLEPGESARQGAIREFREEVGQDLPPGVFVGAWLSPGGIIAHAAVGQTPGQRDAEEWLNAHADEFEHWNGRSPDSHTWHYDPETGEEIDPSEAAVRARQWERDNAHNRLLEHGFRWIDPNNPTMLGFYYRDSPSTPGMGQRVTEPSSWSPYWVLDQGEARGYGANFAPVGMHQRLDDLLANANHQERILANPAEDHRYGGYLSVTASDMSVPPQLDTDWLKTKGYDLGWRPEPEADSSLWSREVPGGIRHFMIWSPARQTWGGYAQAPTGELMTSDKVRAWTSARDAYHGLNVAGWSGRQRQGHRQNQTPESFQGYRPHQTVEHAPEPSDFSVKHDLFQRLNAAPDRVLKPSEIVHAFAGFSANGQAGAACGTVNAQKTTANNDKVTCRRCINFGYGKPEQSGLRRHEAGFWDDLPSHGTSAPGEHVQKLLDTGWKPRHPEQSRAYPDFTKLSPTTGMTHQLYWDRNGSGKWLYTATVPNADEEFGSNRHVNFSDPRRDVSGHIPLNDPDEINAAAKQFEQSYFFGGPHENGIADRITEGEYPWMRSEQAYERHREGNPVTGEHPDRGVSYQEFDPEGYEDDFRYHPFAGGLGKLNSVMKLALESPTGDQIDFIMHGWQPAYEDKTNAYEKHHGGYWHLATYEQDPQSPNGYSWKLNSFTAGGDLISDPDAGDFGDSRHMSPDDVNAKAMGREYQWVRGGLDSTEFKPPMSQRRPIIIPSEEDRHVQFSPDKAWERGVPIDYDKMDPENELHPFQRLNTYAPGDPAMPVIPGAEQAPGVQTSYQDPRQPGMDQMAYDPISGVCLDRGGDTQTRMASEKDDWWRWQPEAKHHPAWNHDFVPMTPAKGERRFGYRIDRTPHGYPHDYQVWEDSENPTPQKAINNYLNQPMVGIKDDYKLDDENDNDAYWEGAYRFKDNRPLCATCYDRGWFPLPEYAHEDRGSDHPFKPLVPESGERRYASGEWRNPAGWARWETHPNLTNWPEGSARTPSQRDMNTGVVQPMFKLKNDLEEISEDAYRHPDESPVCKKCYDDTGVFFPKNLHQNYGGIFAHDFEPLDPEPGERRFAAVTPVYKGFIYLIQQEKQIDLSAVRAIANPDDPDGDMSEQCAWWDIEHAKENPALRPEVATGTPWDELELWADKSVRTNKQVQAAVQKLADVRPPLPEGLEYIDREDRPWRNLTDDEGSTNFWRWRDPELVPPKNPHDQWNFSTSHGNSVDPQPMMMLKDQIPPPGQFHDESMTTLWNEPRCETCYLQRGFPVRESDHPETKGHPFKPMLPDLDERGNLRQASRDPYLPDTFSDESKPAVPGFAAHNNSEYFIRTKDPDHITESNPHSDALFELKSPYDSGLRMEFQHSGDSVCEDCWFAKGHGHPQEQEHFDSTGHKPMEHDLRYMAAYDEYGNWYDHPSDDLEDDDWEDKLTYNPQSGRPFSESAKRDFADRKAEVEGQVAESKQKYQNAPFTAPSRDVRDKQLRLLGPEWNYSEDNNGNALYATKEADGLVHYVTVPNPVWNGGPNKHEAIYRHTVFHPTGEVARRYVGDINRVFDAAEGHHSVGADDSELFPKNNPSLSDIRRDEHLRQLGPGWNYTENQHGLARSAYKNIDGLSHHVEVRSPDRSGEIGYHHKIIRPNGEVANQYVHDINGVFDVSEGKHPSVDNGEQYRESPEEWRARWFVSTRGHRAYQRQRILDDLEFDPERHISFPDAEGKDARKSPQWEMFHDSIYKPKDFEGSSIKGYKHWSGNGDFTWQHYALPIGKATKDPETGNRSIVLASEGRDWPQPGHFGPSTRKITNYLFDTLRRKGHHVQWDDEVLPTEKDEKAFKKAGFERDGADYVRTSEGKRGNIVHHRIIPMMSGYHAGQYRVETYLNGLPKQRIKEPYSVELRPGVKQKGKITVPASAIFDADSAVKETQRRHKRYGSTEDPRPALHPSLKYVDEPGQPFQSWEDAGAGGGEQFWRYRDTDLVPPLEEGDWEETRFPGESHGRSIEVQPMMITKPQTEYQDEDRFDRALSGSKMKVDWNEPICEKCYLQYGHTVPAATHDKSVGADFTEYGFKPHEFTPMLPDRDERGNFRESAFRVNDLESERRHVTRNDKIEPTSIMSANDPVMWNIGGEHYLEKLLGNRWAGNEFLSSLVGRALGADVSKVMLTPRGDINSKRQGTILTKIEPTFKGRRSLTHSERDDLQRNLVRSPRGARIGLLDTLVNVHDHGSVNHGIKADPSEPSGHAPHSIDYESAFHDLRNPHWYHNSPFQEHFIGDYEPLENNPLTQNDVLRGRAALEGLRPIFKAMDREDDHHAMMHRWNQIEKNAGGAEGHDTLPANLPSLSLLAQDSQPKSMMRYLPNGSAIHAYDTGRGRWVHRLFSQDSHPYPVALVRSHEDALDNGGNWQELGYQVGYPRHLMGGPAHSQPRLSAKTAAPWTDDLPTVNRVIRTGDPKAIEWSEGSRVHDVSLPSGDWIAKSPQFRHLSDPEYMKDPWEADYFHRRASEMADMEEFASKLGRALSNPDDEPLVPEAVRGKKKSSDPTPTVYVRKYPRFVEMGPRTNFQRGSSDLFVDEPRGKQIGYLHAILGEGDHTDHSNMGLANGKLVSFDHTHSSLPEYAEALKNASDEPEQVGRMEWYHQFGTSPYERHFLGSDGKGGRGLRASNPLGPQDTERALAASETLRPWAKSRGRAEWLDAAQRRMRMLGQSANGSETMFPYQMKHEVTMEHTASSNLEWTPVVKYRPNRVNVPPARAYSEIRSLISAGRPEFSLREPDQVPVEHHEEISSSKRPLFYPDDPDDLRTPRVYALVNRGANGHTFLAPVTHDATGKDGWLRGVSTTDPSTWNFYHEDDLNNAIRGRTPGTVTPRSAEERYTRGYARGTAPMAEGDVELDAAGHQVVEPRRDPWLELGMERGFADKPEDYEKKYAKAWWVVEDVVAG